VRIEFGMSGSVYIALKDMVGDDAELKVWATTFGFDKDMLKERMKEGQLPEVLSICSLKSLRGSGTKWMVLLGR